MARRSEAPPPKPSQMFDWDSEPYPQQSDTLFGPESAHPSRVAPARVAPARGARRWMVLLLVLTALGAGMIKLLPALLSRMPIH